VQVLDRFARMSRRGLLVALLCGVIGLGLGMIAAYAAQPTSSTDSSANPISAVSPSVPIDVKSTPPVVKDISYPKLSPGLPLNQVHTIGNELATWTYHVPQGWQAFAVCSALGECPPPMQTDDRLTSQQLAQQPEVRYRPPGEPTVGGYSLRVKVLDNTLGLNPGQMVGTKIRGFQQQYGNDQFTLTKQTPRAAYFTYVDGNKHLRFNYFQWFAPQGSPVATLEMSVAGRERDIPGLKALFNRFADNATGTSEPYHPPKQKSEQSNQGKQGKQNNGQNG
jgi:hypothetical protein